MGLSKHSNVEMGTLCLVKKFCIVQRRERGMLAFPFVLEVTNLLPHALELLYIQMLTFYCHMKTVARSNYWKQSKTCLFFFFPECPPVPSSIPHGYINGSGSVQGSLFRFGCKPGYSLVGENNLQCTKEGSWNASVPICLKGAKILCFMNS